MFYKGSRVAIRAGDKVVILKGLRKGAIGRVSSATGTRIVVKLYYRNNFTNERYSRYWAYKASHLGKIEKEGEG